MLRPAMAQESTRVGEAVETSCRTARSQPYQRTRSAAWRIVYQRIRRTILQRVVLLETARNAQRRARRLCRGGSLHRRRRLDCLAIVRPGKAFALSRRLQSDVGLSGCERDGADGESLELSAQGLFSSAASTSRECRDQT